MRNITLVLLAGLFANGAVPAQYASVAPDWALESAQGETVRLSEEVSKQPVVLLFWATWCPYCKALMPHLQSLRLEYGEKVKILAIDFRDDGDPVAFIRDAGYDFTLLPDGDDVAALYKIYGTPGVIIVDRQQVIRFDLRALPQPKLPALGKSPGHRQKAAYLAPYWAAAIRKSLDQILSDASP